MISTFSENLEKSVDKAEMQYWILPKNKIPVCEHSSLCHPKIQVQALSCKEDAISENDPEMLVFSGRKLIQNGLWSGESKCNNLSGNHRHHILRIKEKRDFWLAIVQKPASLKMWGVWNVEIAHLERHHQC